MSCAPACKFVGRQRGCKEGFSCNRCHLCHYARGKERRFKEAQEAFKHADVPDEIAAFAACLQSKIKQNEDAARRQETLMLASSLGSEYMCPPCSPPSTTLCVPSAPGQWTSGNKASGRILSMGTANHPHGCAAACKYVWRKQGCKEGASCQRCHLCHYTRANDRRFKEVQATGVTDFAEEAIPQAVRYNIPSARRAVTPRRREPSGSCSSTTSYTSRPSAKDSDGSWDAGILDDLAVRRTASPMRGSMTTTY